MDSDGIPEASFSGPGMAFAVVRVAATTKSCTEVSFVRDNLSDIGLRARALDAGTCRIARDGVCE